MLLPASIPLGVGIFLGYFGARAGSEGGWNALIGGAMAMGAFALILLIALAVGIGNAMRREGKGRVGAQWAFAAAALLVVGGATGSVAVPVLDLGYQAPVVLEVSLKPSIPGSVTLLLHDPNWITPITDGAGTCSFDAEGSMRLVNVQQAGTLQTAAVTVEFDLAGEPRVANDPLLSLAVDVGPTYWGPIKLTEIAADGKHGRATFSYLPPQGARSSGWPAYLSGEFTWACT